MEKEIREKEKKEKKEKTLEKGSPVYGKDITQQVFVVIAHEKKGLHYAVSSQIFCRDADTFRKGPNQKLYKLTMVTDRQTVCQVRKDCS